MTSKTHTSKSGVMVQPIEPKFHFVWFGPQFPQFAHIAIASALKHNPDAQAILWHGPELHIDATLQRLQTRGLQCHVIDFDSLSTQAKELGAKFDIETLREIYRDLSAPAARSNLVRLLAIFVHGGIYLDTDTLTLKNLDSLRQEGGFCGLEHILWPSGMSKTNVRALALAELRRVCASFALGSTIHRFLLPLYSQAANNAVLGFRKNHPFGGKILQAATQVPKADWAKRFRFGTHLLQRGLQEFNGKELQLNERIAVLAPHYFYPLGPVISRHYFRKTKQVEEDAQKLLSPETHVIHWYASVAQLNQRGFDHILSHRKSEVYSHLCAPYLQLLE